MHYVIIGGDAAGMSAAMQIFKHDQDANITILEAGDTYSYGQCGLPYFVSGEFHDIHDVIARTPKNYRDFGMKAHIFTKVTAINPQLKQVHGTHIRTDESFTYTYDKLLIATGAHPVMPDWPGNTLQQIYTIKTIHDATTIKAAVEAKKRDVTIIGAGYIAMEMAEAFAKQGLHVRMLVRGNQLLKMFDEDMAVHVKEEAEKHYIKIHFHENTERFIGETTVKQVETDKGVYDTDLVLVATGVAPNVAFIEQTTIETGDKQAIRTDAQMKTNLEHIYAAGDCTLAYHRLLQKHVYMPLGTTANKQGRIAGLNMVGKERDFKGIVGTSILQFMDLSLGKTGLSAREAEAASIPYETVTIDVAHMADYFPNTETIHVKLIYAKKTRQLLGGQFIGKAGVDKRIDVIATAITNNMTIDDLEDLDLSYAPPYNTVWDPVQKAARKAASKEN